jgi:hypothetical protein
MHPRYVQAMSTIKIISLFFILIFISCNDEEKHIASLSKPNDTTSVAKSELKVSESAIKEKWDSLCKLSGCLTGGQYVNNGKFGSEGCALTDNPEWLQFFAIKHRDLAAFLIGQIRNTAKTKTHTCPFQNSNKGELAIYCLQNIYKVNFFDLTVPYSEIEKNIVAKYGNEQAWIWAMQKDKKKAWELERQWWIVYKEN